MLQQEGPNSSYMYSLFPSSILVLRQRGEGGRDKAYNWVNIFRFMSYLGFPKKAAPEWMIEVQEVILESPARVGGGWV